MRFETLDQWLKWQESLHPLTIDLGLDRVRQVARKMDLNKIANRIITVGGTNGKGSTVAMLEAIYIAAGYRVASYTSPHLLRYNERVRLNGQEADDKAFCDAFERVDRARGEISLTYFEFGTLAAFDLLQRANLDVAILEVGLGGRLDAVNIIDADVAVITSVDLDHMSWLGDTREKIAAEKFGIARAGKPLVLGENRPTQNWNSLIEQTGAIGYQIDKDFRVRNHGATFDFQSTILSRTSLPAPALRGAHQFQNAACALMTVALLHQQLPVSIDALRTGLLTAFVAGRFEVKRIGEMTRILDVAHNPHGCAQLARNLSAFPRPGKTWAVVSMLGDKDQIASLSPLATVIDHWSVAGLDVPRGVSSEAMAQSIIASGAATATVQRYNAVVDAYRAVLAQAGANDVIVVFGSFYTVAAVKELDPGVKSDG